MELLCKLRNRSIRAPELLQNATSSGVRERGKGGVEASCRKLNHMVQCLAHRSVSRKKTEIGYQALGETQTFKVSALDGQRGNVQ